jgi:predicted double-glycine peptidase
MENFPYHKQETIWSCGAASMRMALENNGIKKSEKQLIPLLKTNKIIGTWPREFPKVAEKYGLNYIVKRDAEISDLKKLKKEGYTIIVCYYIPEEKGFHHSIVRNITAKEISFYDPWFGENHKYNLEHFYKNWKFESKSDKENRWLFAVKK